MLHVAVVQQLVQGRVGEYVDPGRLRELNRVAGGGVRDGAQAVRVRRLDQRPDGGPVEPGRDRR